MSHRIYTHDSHRIYTRHYINIFIYEKIHYINIIIYEKIHSNIIYTRTYSVYPLTEEIILKNVWNPIS